MTTAEELEAAIKGAESAATKLSGILERFDLTGIPFCDKDLNKVDVGSKILAAKFLLSVLKATERQSAARERRGDMGQY